MQVTLSHYRVLEEIGKGGMGVVYRAHDERLERDVALKVLPAGALADEAARKRFKKEALALSKLNHPNIATIFDFDSQEGMDFLVEEFIPGQSLHELLAFGAIPEHDILHLGVQICEGLATAHEQGIVHRDLKPANIRVMPTPDRRVKILDFGLAKVLPKTSIGSDEVTATFSETQSVSGTLPYMAPEQVMNERLDARTDIWALGCVLYEMATGRRPFAGSGITLADQIRQQQPAPPAKVNGKVSFGLEAIILKCLEKDPGRRYASTRDIAVALRQLETGVVPRAQRERQRRKAWKTIAAVVAALVLAGVGYSVYRWTMPSARPIRSIAVLPLANLSGDPTQEYFADGMTESLITNLGKLTGLKKVMARTAVMRFKESKQSPADIARELKVDGLVTGGVLRSGNNVRVTAQLINPATGEQLWTQTYQHDVGDILRLQNEMTTAIAAEIRIKISANEQARLASSRPVNPEAYDAYLLGRYYMYKMSPQGLQQAIEYYQIALEKDPNYSPALLGIASVWGLREHLGYVASEEGSARAKSIVLKVLETDNTAEAHYQLAPGLAWHDWEWDAGLREFQRAIELNPNYSDARFFYSLTLYALRRSDEAKQQMDIALTLDPYNPQFHVYSAVELRAEGHLAEALLELDRAAELGGGSPQELARTYEQMGRYKEAIDAWKNFYAAQPEAVRALEEGYASGNYKNAMRRVADALAKQHIKGADRQSMTIASHYVAAGEDALALDWLEAACDKRIGPLPYINAHNGPFESLRSHPRFQELLRRMNLLR